MCVRRLWIGLTKMQSKKPEFLYHATSLTDISEFKPRNHTPRYADEPNLIFATPHLEVAAMFLRPKGVSTEISVYGSRYVIFINATPEEYARHDSGGAVYVLPSAAFETSNIGMGKIEWTSKVPVRPVSKVLFKSSIEAMDKYGVERYFVDNRIMGQIRANPAKALDLVE